MVEARPSEWLSRRVPKYFDEYQSKMLHIIVPIVRVGAGCPFEGLIN
jgi:hypothetical protein